MIAAAIVAAAACSGGPAFARTPAGDARAATAVVRASDVPPGWQTAPTVSLLPLMPGLENAAARGFASSTWFDRGAVVRSTVVVLTRPRDAEQAFAQAKSFESCAASLLGARKAKRLGAAGYRVAAPRPAEGGADTVELWFLRRGPAFAAVGLLSGGEFDPRLRRRILARVAGRLAAPTPGR
jgi:hypothetical protein